jgi:hypothetical protein
MIEIARSQASFQARSPLRLHKQNLSRAYLGFHSVKVILSRHHCSPFSARCCRRPPRALGERRNYIDAEAQRQSRNCLPQLEQVISHHLLSTRLALDEDRRTALLLLTPALRFAFQRLRETPLLSRSCFASSYMICLYVIVSALHSLRVSGRSGLHP